MVIPICIQDDNEEARRKWDLVHPVSLLKPKAQRKRRRHTQLCMSRSIPTQPTKLALECEAELNDAQLLHLDAGCHATLELEFSGHECLLA
jgi:hypothetical protein